MNARHGRCKLKALLATNIQEPWSRLVRSRWQMADEEDIRHKAALTILRHKLVLAIKTFIQTYQRLIFIPRKLALHAKLHIRRTPLSLQHSANPLNRTQGIRGVIHGASQR